MLRGRFPIDEQRLHLRGGEARPWRVIKDPSAMFLKASFRLGDLQAGGFDNGTVFRNEQTGERRMVDAMGVVRRIRPQKKKCRDRRKPVLIKAVKPIRGGGSRSHAIH